jgi:hypothetical protein
MAQIINRPMTNDGIALPLVGSMISNTVAASRWCKGQKMSAMLAQR